MRWSELVENPTVTGRLGGSARPVKFLESCLTESTAVLPRVALDARCTALVRRECGGARLVADHI